MTLFTSLANWPLIVLTPVAVVVVGHLGFALAAFLVRDKARRA
jgi:hypothetical protein